MAYQLKKTKKVTEELELINDDGSLFTTICVELDRAGLVKKVNEKYVELLKAQSEVAALQAGGGQPLDAGALKDAIELYSGIAWDLFGIIFGERDAKTILDFYDGDLMEVCQQIMPFVTQVLVPRIRKIAQEIRKQAMRSYKPKVGWFGK